MPGNFLRYTAALLLVAPTPALFAAGPFTLSNGFFEVSGTDGLVTSLRFDHTGTGAYDNNAIDGGGRYGYTLDGTLLQSASCVYNQTANQLTITNLPESATVTITLNGAQMDTLVEFSGTKTTQFDWQMPFLGAGFYDRTTGQNTSPSAAIDMPFESFWNPGATNEGFWNIESLKQWVGTDRGFFAPMAMRARGPRDDSATFNASWFGSRLQVDSNRLTARVGPANATNAAVTVLNLSEKSYSYEMGGRPAPEFFVEPEIAIPQQNAPGQTFPASGLLTEFFQHTVWWWGPAGGVWSDWSMQAAAFMDNGYSDTMREFLQVWIISDDGYGTPWYAWTWGDRRGWPLDDGDARHMNTNAIFISALARYVTWRGDMDFLTGGDPDFRVRIGYSDATTELTVADGEPTHAIFAPRSEDSFFADSIPLGQTFTATKPFTSVAVYLTDYDNGDSDMTLSLLDAPGGTVLASLAFEDIANNAWSQLTFPQQPAGDYFVQISDYDDGDLAWYAYRNLGDEDIYPAGEGYRDGFAMGDMITRARGLMGYYQNKLQTAANDYVILATTGSSEQWGRDGDNTTNWYDLLPFGYEDLFTNLNYYEALDGMAKLEEMMGNSAQAAVYRQQMASFETAFNNRFWRTPIDNGVQRGRYIVTIDSNGVERDYGFAGLNMWAVSLGLADSSQVSSIIAWMENGESRNNSGVWTQDIYDRFTFAPRGQSLYNGGEWVARNTPNWEELQNGGAALHESGWDVVGRAKYDSPDGAWDRLKTILSRYTVPDRMSVENGFFGEEGQGFGSSGDVGWLYGEFPETAILGAAFFRGFFGVEAHHDRLVLQPRIPTELDAIGARNIIYRDAAFTFRATDAEVTVSVTANPNDVSFSFNGGPRYGETFTDIVVPLDGDGKLTITPSGGGALSWNFNVDGEFEGWSAPTPVSTVENQEVSGGSLNYDIIGADPIIQIGNGITTVFDAGEYPWIYLRLRNESGGSQVRTFYQRPDSTFGTQLYSIASGPNVRDYAFRAADVADWSNPVPLFRLDIPDNAPGTGSVSIDRISLHPTQPPVTNTDWQFDTVGYAEGWTLANHLNLTSVSGGRAVYSLTGTDPQLLSPLSSLAAENLRFLVLRFGNSTPGTAARLYWETAAEPGYTEQNSAIIPIVPNRANVTPTVVDLQGAPGLLGEITRLRLDPIDENGTGSGTFSIGEIAFHSTAPALGMTAQLSAASIAFGETGLGGTMSMGLTIDNTGPSDPLVVWSVTIGGEDADQFRLSNPATPIILAPGMNPMATVQVSHEPTRLGTHSATLEIQTNDPQALVLSVPLQGIGSAAVVEDWNVY